jgi:hypothetical protein
MRLLPNIDDSRVNRSLPDVQSMDMVKGTRSGRHGESNDLVMQRCDVMGLSTDVGMSHFFCFAVAATSTEKRARSQTEERILLL